MIAVKLLCIGSLKEGYLRAACAEYEKRLSPFCRLSVWEGEEFRLPASPSPAQIERALMEEGKSLLRKRGNGYAVSLCVEGEMLSSPQLARRMEDLAVRGVSEIDFCIGGSFGLSEQVKAASELRLSLSPMTFPHQLTRIILLEQIYRAFQITAGTRYHK